ncbi:hypothetical protein [Allopontixanthobacter sp.]|uniref:hypothetical protein n=1 Tax=Allopontixanthobacter sp. TaxID=2906452 RepID=UPI002ABBE842|nr:hypothetical protein [Allopontixanthobacter sp.]MDZ4307113.1 hypothetical protein [Allopontixanthobacter sp.]
MAGKKGGGRYRSAISGRYVTAKHGKVSPRTTVKESGGKSGSTGGAYRSAISGRFVTAKQGRSSPHTTVREK